MNKKLIFSIIVAILAVSAVFAYQKYNKPEEISSNIDTSDWLTYRNEEYGFELKYPKEWVVEVKESNNPIIILTSEKTKKILEESISKGIYVEDIKGDIWISKISNNNESLFDYLNKNLEKENKISPIGLINFNKIIFNNHEAFEALFGGYGSYYSILFENKNNFISITFGLKDKKESLSIEEKTILSSFRFID